METHASLWRAHVSAALHPTEAELKAYDSNTRRDAGTCLKRFLLSQSDGALKGIPRDVIDSLCALYELARHEASVSYLLQQSSAVLCQKLSL